MKNTELQKSVDEVLTSIDTLEMELLGQNTEIIKLNNEVTIQKTETQKKDGELQKYKRVVNEQITQIMKIKQEQDVMRRRLTSCKCDLPETKLALKQKNLIMKETEKISEESQSEYETS